MSSNAALLDELQRDVIRDGRIEDIEVTMRRPPPAKRGMAATLPGIENAAAIDELLRDVIRGNFTGRVVLHCSGEDFTGRVVISCRRGRIYDIEVTTRRRIQEALGIDGTVALSHT